MPAYSPFNYRHLDDRRQKSSQPKKHLPHHSGRYHGWRAFFRFMLFAGVFVISIVVLGGTGYVWSVVSGIPDTQTLENLSIPQSTVIMDREGNELYNIHGAENRRYVRLDEISTSLKNATIAAEDTNFYKHPGFDVWGLIGAVKQKILNPDTRLRGASTITQQLVKILFLSSERSVERKLKELITAAQLEHRYSKDKILELYLNQISYGSNSSGIETASQTYFGKSAKDLNLAESAILASLPKGPSYYSPFGENPARLMGQCAAEEAKAAEEKFSLEISSDRKLTVKVTTDDSRSESFTLAAKEKRVIDATAKVHLSVNQAPGLQVQYKGKALTLPNAKEVDVSLDLAREQTGEKKPVASACASMEDPRYTIGRKDYVLKRMAEEGMITWEEAQSAWETANKVVFKKNRETIKYPHFVFYVKDYLESKYGQELVEKGGLQVKTTIDPKLQDIAEDLIAKKIPDLEKNYKLSNAALLSANSKTGEILAMVGSRHYWDEKIDGKVNITTSLQQPGSSFKPFIYSAFIAAGNGAGSILWDTKTKFGNDEPDNADGVFKGPLPVRRALAWSRNIPAIKAYFLAGEEEKILEYLKNFGMDLFTAREQARTKNPDFSYGYPLAIGSADVRMMDMVQGYAVLANQGVKKELTSILEVKDKDGNILEALDDNPGAQTLDPQVAYIVNDILSDKNARPAGFWRDRITVPNHVVAVKTGTSNGKFADGRILPVDNWTVGYSRSLVTALWGGNNNNAALAPNAFDVNTLASTWRDYMTKALEGKPAEPFDKPEGITSATVSLLSGLRATQNTPEDLRVTDIFPSFGVPEGFDGSLATVRIDTRNNLLANDDCPPAFVREAYAFTGNLPTKQFNWQESPWSFADNSNTNASALLAKAPTEVSPLCTARSEDQKPSLSIVSPLSFGQVVPGLITVAVRATAPSGIDRVEYFLDGNLTTTASAAPHVGTFVLSASNAVNSVHTIRALLTDRDGFTAEASVDVTVTNTDTSPPRVSFLSPAERASVSLDSIFTILVDAYDDSSSIRAVDIALNGKVVSSPKRAPYQAIINLSREPYPPGPYEVTATATDRFGNKQTATVTVTFIAAGDSPDTPSPQATSSPASTSDRSLRITRPDEGALIATDTSQEIRILSRDGQQRTVEIYATVSGQETLIQKIPDVSPDVENVVAFWKPKTSGTYELLAKVVYSSGVTLSSDPLSVTVH